MVQYRQLETEVLRAVHDAARDGGAQPAFFDEVLSDINGLLDNIQIVPAGATFKIVSKALGEPIDAQRISSGEGELISLAIECLVFASQLVTDRVNLLLLDEPDVHLHPDLQSRLMKFLLRLVAKNDFSIIMAARTRMSTTTTAHDA